MDKEKKNENKEKEEINLYTKGGRKERAQI